MKSGLVLCVCWTFYQRSVYRCCAGGDEKDSSRWLLRKNGRRLGSIDLLYSFPEKTQKLLKENSLDDWTHNKTIQKIRESLRISKEEKEMLKTWKR